MKMFILTLLSTFFLTSCAPNQSWTIVSPESYELDGIGIGIPDALLFQSQTDNDRFILVFHKMDLGTEDSRFSTYAYLIRWDKRNIDKLSPVAYTLTDSTINVKEVSGWNMTTGIIGYDPKINWSEKSVEFKPSTVAFVKLLVK